MPAHVFESILHFDRPIAVQSAAHDPIVADRIIAIQAKPFDMDDKRVSRSRRLNVKRPSLWIASQDSRYALFVRASGIHRRGVNRVAWSNSQNGFVLSGKPPVKSGRRKFVALRRSGPPCRIQLRRE